MMHRAVTILVLVFVIAFCIDAHGSRRRGRGRRPGHHHRPRPRRPRFDKYRWDVDLGSNVKVEQDAFVAVDGDDVRLWTHKGRIMEPDILNSLVYINTKTKLMVVKPAAAGHRWRKANCYLTTLEDSKDEIVGNLTQWHKDKVIRMNNGQSLNGTAPPMKWREANKIMRENRALEMMCLSCNLIPTVGVTVTSIDNDSGYGTASITVGTDSDSATEDPDVETLNLLGYDSRLTIIVPKPKPVKKQKWWRSSKRGGGRRKGWK